MSHPKSGPKIHSEEYCDALKIAQAPPRSAVGNQVATMRPLPGKTGVCARPEANRFIYLRDLATGEFWSAAHQPCRRATKRYEAIFTQARAEFRQFNAGLEIHTEISVSPEDDVELRRVTLTNHSHTPRVIELTSYAEVVLAPAAADASHPAFSNLFVQTEFLRPRPAVLCTRRPRSEGEKPPWLFNFMIGQGGQQGEVSCETDRARFIRSDCARAQPCFAPVGPAPKGKNRPGS